MKLFGSWQIFAIGSAFFAVADGYLRQARRRGGIVKLGWG